MNKKTAELLGAAIPMHEKLGRYERFDPRPDLPFAEQMPVMSLGEKIAFAVVIGVCFVVGAMA